MGAVLGSIATLLPVVNSHAAQANRYMGELSTEALPDGTPGTRLHREGVFLGILFGWFSCEFGAILTGAARAALEEYEQLLRNKPLLFDPRRTRMHDPELQRIFGEAMCRADAANPCNRLSPRQA